MLFDLVGETRLDQRIESEITALHELVPRVDAFASFLQFQEYLRKVVSNGLEPVQEHLILQRSLAQETTNNGSPIGFTVKQILSSIYRYLGVAIEVIRACTFRFAVLLTSLVAILPILTVGLVDGLVRRDVRRWSGGRESTLIFAYASKSVEPLFGLCVLVYVAWPWELNFAILNTILAISLTVLVSISVSRFKKYV